LLSMIPRPPTPTLFPYTTLFRSIDTIGGEFNAFTGKEYTGYYVKCAAESRDIALDVLVDMLRNSKFAPDEIDREKGVIIEEMNRSEEHTSELQSRSDLVCRLLLE